MIWFILVLFSFVLGYFCNLVYGWIKDVAARGKMRSASVTFDDDGLVELRVFDAKKRKQYHPDLVYWAREKVVDMSFTRVEAMRAASTVCELRKLNADASIRLTVTKDSGVSSCIIPKWAGASVERELTTFCREQFNWNGSYPQEDPKIGPYR